LGEIAQEQPDTAADSRKLDDDEDRQNPAYVPRKGAFFEHDLRRGSEDDTGKADETKPYVGNSFICFTYHLLDLTVFPVREVINSIFTRLDTVTTTTTILLAIRE